jgi:hypothetical protein
MGTRSQMATTLASATNDFPPCATKFFASSVARVACVALQPTSIILSLHPNVFSNARSLLAVRNRSRTPAISWRTDQIRSSITPLCENLATRPNLFLGSLVINNSNSAQPSGSESSSRVRRAGSTTAASAFFRHRTPGPFSPLRWCARGACWLYRRFFNRPEESRAPK